MKRNGKDDGAIDPNEILNSFRRSDTSIPPSARAVEEPRPVNGTETDLSPVQEEPPPEKGTRQEVKRKAKGKGRDYPDLFLKESDIPARMGKTAYIRKEYHERIQRIVRIIAKDEITLSAYLDNVLAYHFECFQDEIVELYESNNSIF